MPAFGLGPEQSLSMQVSLQLTNSQDRSPTEAWHWPKNTSAIARNALSNRIFLVYLGLKGGLIALWGCYIAFSPCRDQVIYLFFLPVTTELSTANMFSFGFREEDDEEGEVVNRINYKEFLSQKMELPEEFEPRSYSMRDLLISSKKHGDNFTPYRISFEHIQITSTCIVPKRDIYDVKYSLMKSDKLNETQQILLNDHEDLRKNTYEGGAKVWECTLDLIKYLENSFPLGQASLLELGCGAGLPVARNLQILLQNRDPSVNNHEPAKLVLADYNRDVLELTTAPNVLLAWLSIVNPDANAEGEVDITPTLIEQFEADLANRNIQVTFVSGAWSPQFVQLVAEQSAYDMVLASETIYAPETVSVFTDTLLNCMASEGSALVAAKKIYFGVGGGIPEFETQLRLRDVPYSIAMDYKEGVGRAIIGLGRQCSAV